MNIMSTLHNAENDPMIALNCVSETKTNTHLNIKVIQSVQQKTKLFHLWFITLKFKTNALKPFLYC